MTAPPRGRLLALLLAALLGPAVAHAAEPRARDLGIPFDGTPGRWNAITDVAGVLVGHTTIVEGEGDHAARTGVTAVRPNADGHRVFAAVDSHNGDGEMTGAHFIQEKGYLTGPILMTNTISVGDAASALIKWSRQAKGFEHTINLPVVAETWDGDLNDIYGFHVEPRHVFAALDAAATGPVAEGNVGGGTGMICHEFKGGIGTASRVLSKEDGGFTVGVLVQANYGDRQDFRVAGIPVGHEIEGYEPEIQPGGDDASEGDGSILVLVATDAPLLPHQLRRLTQRIPMGLARNGSFSSTYSGDIFLAFSTQSIEKHGLTASASLIEERAINEIFRATVQATEEAEINALVAARTMVGRRGNRVHALPHDALRYVLRRHGRLIEP